MEEDGDEEDEEDKEEHDDDEDNDGDIDNDLLTLYQVHLAPVSMQQSSVKKKTFSAPICGAFNKAFFYLISFFNSSRGRLP